MPYPLKNNNYYYPQRISGGQRRKVYNLPPVKTNRTLQIKKRQKKRVNPLKAFISFCFLCLVGYFVMPYNYETFFEPMILNRFLNKNLDMRAQNYYAPTLNYLSNHNFNGQNIISKARVSDKQMIQINSTGRINSLEASLLKLSKAYPHLHPSIYVYDYISGGTVEINADEIFPSASIIKIPILFELFRKSEALERQGDMPIDLNSTMIFDEIHKTTGSGEMQYGSLNKPHSLKFLANEMIVSSDNSATNMILDKIGGMNQMNSALRRWGFKNTQMSSWLPDLNGTNTISAKDVSTMLYNLDTPKFLNSESKEYIRYSMSNVHNIRLLKAGLPNDAILLHKTGDIGVMLGDAGIVYRPDGKKYIVSILVKRPHNDYSARDFIQKASSIIYKEIYTSHLY